MASPLQLTFKRFDLKLTDTWRIASGQGTNTYPVVFVELTSHDGFRGIGEAAPSDRYAETADTVQAFLRKVDPGRLSFADIPQTMAYLETVASGNYSAKAAINLALVDGVAKAARLPVYDFLHLGFRDNQHLTSFSIGIDEPDVIRRKVERAANYPVLKLKVGSPNDAETLRIVREVAPHKRLRVDANEAWATKEQALKNIESLAQDKNIEFIEQPMPCTSNPADLAWLKDRSPLPLFGDESYHHASDLNRCVDCFHGVNVKLVKAGGLTGAYDALRAARAAGLKTMIGCMIESSLLITAAAHLAELADYLDIDGNLLIDNDPYAGASSKNGTISFTNAPEPFGLRVRERGP